MSSHVESHGEDPAFVVFFSLLIPGLVQLLRGRMLAGALFASSSVVLFILGLAVADLRGAAWLTATGIAVWSIADALRKPRAGEAHRVS